MKDPRISFEQPHHLQNIIIWYDLWNEDVIGLCSFENDDEMAAAVNGHLYRWCCKHFRKLK